MLTIDYKVTNYYWIVVEYSIIFVLLLVSQLASELNEIFKRLVLFLTFALLLGVYQRIQPYVHHIHRKMNFFSIFVILITITFEMTGNMSNNFNFMPLISKIFIMGSNLSFYLVCGILIIRIFYVQTKQELKSINIKEKLKSRFSLKSKKTTK